MYKYSLGGGSTLCYTSMLGWVHFTPYIDFLPGYLFIVFVSTINRKTAFVFICYKVPRGDDRPNMYLKLMHLG